MKQSGIHIIHSNFSNRSLALQLLFSYGVLSRTDIAEYLNITNAAITSIVNDFLQEGLLIQQDVPSDRPPRVGRKKSPLSINYNWKYILAIDIHSHYINIAITNLKGDVLEESSQIPDNHSPEALCSGIAKDCIKMLWKSSISIDKILGAGITIIGPVNQIDGIALHPFRLFDYAVPIKQYFEKEFPFPVAVENNVCAFLISELIYTDIANKNQNILMLKWGPGVGSAMAIRGHIYKGYNYQSTEIGHNQITETDGKKCNCGRTGCLEPSVSSDAIIDFIQHEATSNPDGSIAKMVASIGSPSRENLSSFLDLASESEIFTEYLEKCAHSLAAVTNNAIHILAPDKLLLIGDLFEHDFMVGLFTEQLYSINSQLPAGLCLKDPLSADKKYIGATAIAVEQLLFPI